MKKILILPFRISQNNESTNYLPEGILEELIYLLSSKEGLQTSSRSTSLYLGLHPIPLKEVYKKFEVDYVLEGNIRKEVGGYFLVSQLYESVTEKLIFNLKIYFQLDSWTSSLNQLTSMVLNKTINTSISNVAELDSTKKREFYQQGLYHWNRFTYHEMTLAITFFTKAIKEDENFAQAYAALADCYSIIGLMGYNNPKEAFTKAKKAVKKALLLNDKRSESYVSAAFVNIFFDKDLQKSKQNLLQALKLNKDNLKAHHLFAMHYIHLSDLKNAEKHALITLKLDTLSLPHYAMMGRICLYQRQYKKALAFIDAGLNINSNAIPLFEMRGQIHLVSGNIEAAIEDLKLCTDKNISDAVSLAYLGHAYSKIGFFTEARIIESKIDSLGLNKNSGMYNYAMAIFNLGQNNIHQFLNHIEKSVATRLGFINGELLNHPIFSEVKKNKRVQQLTNGFRSNKTDKTVQTNRKPSVFIDIKSQTSESLVIDPQDISFIEAHDNYAFIYHLKEDVITKTMLRVSLKKLELQLKKYSYLYRCHKSYIINLDEQMSLKGNSKDAYFESDFFPKRIPTSRSKWKFLAALSQN